ncbi:MAG: HIT family protein [Candidatus Buchananbacteria bacterium]|nr:HIT family protein [Candidatus Buchananbacteria bacterium]
MDDCIFCKIIKGEIPSYKVYENGDVLAFLDITPVNSGHTLVISKNHYDNLIDLPEEEAGKLINVIKKITPAIVKATEADGFNLNLNNGSAAGQVINHVHFHIVPRKNNDGYKLWPGHVYPAGEAEIVLEKIKSNL